MTVEAELVLMVTTDVAVTTGGVKVVGTVKVSISRDVEYAVEIY